MKLPQIIQGGMGVAVSDWRLAKTVSKLGQLGVVSGTGICTVLIRRLQDGDLKGNIRRALEHFPDSGFVEEILKTYFKSDRRAVGPAASQSQGYKRRSLPTINPSLFSQRLGAIASFVEVFLAKEKHDGIVGINFLEKLQVANLPGIYGAMLAGVTYVLMGAGVPREIPGVLDLFSRQQAASIKVTVSGTNHRQGSNADLYISFDPTEVFPEITAKEKELLRPKFLAIISSGTLALHLAKKATGKVDGFVVEGPTAGGHNAPPRGLLQLNDRGEPIYGVKDAADLAMIRDIGLPFWLAGSYGRPDKFRQALSLGATGIQVGTAFAFCDESGLSEEYRKAVLSGFNPERAVVGSAQPAAVFTDPLASPTGFPFKVASLEGTLSDSSLYQARKRKCDLGYLRQVTTHPDGHVVYRCASEPVEDYLAKGGKIEDTVGRKCLCNALMANIGLGQIQENGYLELPLLTAGDDLSELRRYLPEGRQSYSAKDVISYLMSS